MRPPGTATLTKCGAGTSSDKELPISDAASQLASRATRPVDDPARNSARTKCGRCFSITAWDAFLFVGIFVGIHMIFY
jgi:hypothetical protein